MQRPCLNGNCKKSNIFWDSRAAFLCVMLQTSPIVEHTAVGVAISWPFYAVLISSSC